ncbi:MAG TPA: glycine--tRNA ligase [Verrucomicrobia bacterium]|nr:glycine--tRNA ligase [Verrucomicrobiota bacterium]HOB32515.1 glycine--tRNA ligase [Verrucomicrobiota bacterium]HOP98616.1 glycine--tRNA ligase [Verrucomicrobiota bacterium]HPU57157.1 glycine--tRNA ligase [Verrucomicrobiota bacterium]
MAEPKENPLMEKIVSLCKRRGFIFQSSEIYGGINGFWDYGPLGAELKRNVKELWWNAMIRQRDGVVGLEATIIMSPLIWKASGHVDTFSDPMIDCKTCKGRFRADQINEIPCPQKPSKMVSECHGEKTPPRAFNLMFQTYVGPVQDESSIAYLRPETAQAIFAQFKNVLETSRQKVPFGIAQMGKAFRNEVTPRNYTFRSREFEQMELEFFIKPDEVVEAIHGKVTPASELAQGAPLEPQPTWGWEAWHKYWVEERIRFYEGIGLPRATLEEYWQKPDELAHYARATVDILFKFPFGTQELEGIAARSDFDLSQHERFSGKPMAVFDEELRAAWSKLDEVKKAELKKRYYEARLKYLLKMGVENEKAEKEAREDAEGLAKGQYIPHVIEPSAGVDRLILALICHAYHEDQMPDEKGKMETRVVLRFHPRVAPIKVGVLPLLKNRPELVRQALEIRDLLRPHMNVFYDDAGAIGRRYRRQDEAGTPFCVTVDFDTLGEKPELKGTVTLRHRDDGRQDRVKISELLPLLQEKIR